MLKLNRSWHLIGIIIDVLISFGKKNFPWEKVRREMVSSEFVLINSEQPEMKNFGKFRRIRFHFWSAAAETKVWTVAGRLDFCSCGIRGQQRCLASDRPGVQSLPLKVFWCRWIILIVECQIDCFERNEVRWNSSWLVVPESNKGFNLKTTIDARIKQWL